MATVAPASVADFKAKFDRAFPYGPGKDAVRDSDITGAFNDALTVFNPALWSETSQAKLAFLYAAAHFVAVNIQAAGGLNVDASDQGVNGRSAGVASSKSVGQVSISYTEPPERVKRIPHLLAMWETEFGKRYVTMLLPRMVGNVGIVGGWSSAEGGEYIAVPDANPS